MKKDLLTVRDVDEETLVKFKTKAAGHKMKMGEALTEAMRVWIKTKDVKKKDGSGLARLSSFDCGQDTL